MKDYYRTLGVERSASAEDIKRAYRRAASRHHPDKGGDTQQFQEIEEAYRVLGDPAQRQQYDNPGIKININGGFMREFNRFIAIGIPQDIRSTDFHLVYFPFTECCDICEVFCSFQP